MENVCVRFKKQLLADAVTEQHTRKKHSLSSAASGTDRSDNTVTQKSAQADSAIHLDFTRVLGRMHRCSLQLHRLLFVRDLREKSK